MEESADCIQWHLHSPVRCRKLRRRTFITLSIGVDVFCFVVLSLFRCFASTFLSIDDFRRFSAIGVGWASSDEQRRRQEEGRRRRPRLPQVRQTVLSVDNATFDADVSVRGGTWKFDRLKKHRNTRYEQNLMRHFKESQPCFFVWKFSKPHPIFVKPASTYPLMDLSNFNFMRPTGIQMQIFFDSKVLKSFWFKLVRV